MFPSYYRPLLLSFLLLLFANLPITAQNKDLSDQVQSNTQQIEDLKKTNLEIWDSISILTQSQRDKATSGEVNQKYLREIMARLDDVEKRLLALETKDSTAAKAKLEKPKKGLP